MAGNESWVYQGRQSHGWFGTGTGPHSNGSAEAQADELFQPTGTSKRVDYAASSIIMHVARGDRVRWESAVNDAAREKLRAIIPVWYNASTLSRNAFRAQFLDPYTSDEIVDRLRSVAKTIVDARTHEELADAGKGLTAAALHIGVDAWPRFLSNSQWRAKEISEQGGAAIVTMAASETLQAQQPSSAQSRVSAEAPNELQTTMPPSKSFYADNRSRAYCIARCSDLALPTRNYGLSFQRCLLTCTGQNSFPEWAPHFP